MKIRREESTLSNGESVPPESHQSHEDRSYWPIEQFGAQEVRVEVYGTPRAQGSLDLITSRSTGKAFGRMKPNVVEWRNTVVGEMRSLIERGEITPMLVGPLRLEVDFCFERPKSHPQRRRRSDRAVKYNMPDLDKLLRTIGDAAKIAGLIGDDAQFAEMAGRKLYVEDGEPEGAQITILRVPGGYEVPAKT